TADKYNAVSSAVWNATSAVLAGRVKGAAAVQQLERDINKVKRGRQW
ncbi:ABC transporter substrate-binding protein, partial [Enterococcus faecium]